MRKFKIIKIEDNTYPEQLRKISNPPEQLYTIGNIDLLKTNCISIIGSRNCSTNGIKLAKKFAKELVFQGLTIVSGMAIGIDTAAHESTLDEGGKTIAVLGDGFNSIFPEENIGLYKRIIESEGLIITEYTPEEEAKSKNFLERNRIVSGLSLGILVVEAAYRSGTSVTARIAKMQGRKVFAVPHGLNDKHGVGTNNLIKEGAKIVTSTEDIIKEFEFLEYKIPPKENPIEKGKRKICNNKEYDEIYQFITEEPISIEEIYRRTNKKLEQINNILIMLELEEYIEKVAGGYICILNKK